MYHIFFRFSLEWEGTKVVPNVINSLILVESAHVERFFSKDFLTGRFYAEIKNAEVKIYALDSNNYLIIANVSEKFTHGEVIYLIHMYFDNYIKLFLACCKFNSLDRNCNQCILCYIKTSTVVCKL